MVTSDAQLDRADTALGGDTPPELFELDLRPPHLRPALVFRRQLVDRLQASDEDIIAITAPIGYGKTVTLAQWASVQSSPVAWLRLHHEDSNAKRLIYRLAASLSEIGITTREEVAKFRFIRDTEVTPRGVMRLALLLRSRAPGVTLIIDSAEHLRTRAAVEVIAELTRQLAGTGRLVVAGRSEPRLDLPILRSQGRILELDQQDLKMSEEETREVISVHDLDPDWVPRITEITDGWPAAIFLLALSRKRWGRDIEESRAAGSIALLSDFVMRTIVPHLTKRRRDFLTRVSPLDRLSGPLCDAVTGSGKSGQLLREIDVSTHLVHPVDATGDWYRMNRVVREALLAESSSADPAMVADVHRRAAAWYETNEMTESAMEHSVLAGDGPAVARGLRQVTKTTFAGGGLSHVLDWMAWLESNDTLSKYPEAAALGALVYGLEGVALEVDRWLAAATSARPDKAPPPLVWLVRALTLNAGIEQMKRDMASFRGALEPGSEWLPAALLTQGLASIWSGELDEAEPLMTEAAALGEQSGSWPTTSLAYAERGILALGRRDWDLASHLTRTSIRIINEHGLDRYATSGLGWVAAARCARHENDIPEAKMLLARATSVRPHLSAAFPGVAVQTQIEMARAHLELSDVVGAREVLRDATDILAQRPDLGNLPDQLQALKESLADRGPGTIGPSALTRAELRLLPLLATHLSFPEIGEELFISRHTVKTQAMAIYRKLGTSSRSDAVAKAFDAGLLTR